MLADKLPELEKLCPEIVDVIASWLPGSGAEDYVVSANITATKPGVAAVPGGVFVGFVESGAEETRETKTTRENKMQQTDRAMINVGERGGATRNSRKITPKEMELYIIYNYK